MWACWLVQHVLASREGKWEVESLQQAQQWSFPALYGFLEAMHAGGETFYVRDPATRLVLHRYKLPFKRMTVPPKDNEAFKWRKGAQRLSDWLQAGGLAPLHPGIVAQRAPTVVPPPPLAASRQAHRAALWGRVAKRANQRALQSVGGEEADVRETHGVVEGVLNESRGLSDEQADAMEAELEREMAAAGSGDQPIPVTPEPSTPLPEPAPSLEGLAATQDRHPPVWHINELLSDIIDTHSP